MDFCQPWKVEMKKCSKMFYIYWCLKEAYNKAVGKGLSIDLDILYFDILKEK